MRYMESSKLLWLLVLTLALVAGGAQAAPPPGKGGGGGGKTTPGNNLSLPVIWSEGYALPLRGVFGAPVFGGVAWPEDCGALGLECWYLQQDELNTWQAESVDWSAAPVAVSWIDWGDNLEAKPWYVTSIVRTEVVLYQDLTVPMTAFTMAHLWGQGPSEMWGTNTVQYPSTEATVYSRCARFTIQQLTEDPGSVGFFVAWNPATGVWEGDAGAALYNSAVWMGTEGPSGAYSAEINVAGKVIYGYNWNVRKTGDGSGYYRLTFSLDGLNCPLVLNTFFIDGVTQIKPTAEEEVLVPGPSFPPGPRITAEEPGGGVAVIDFANNLSYIDVQILPNKGGGGKKPR